MPELRVLGPIESVVTATDRAAAEGVAAGAGVASERVERVVRAAAFSQTLSKAALTAWSRSSVAPAAYASRQAWAPTRERAAAKNRLSRCSAMMGSWRSA